MIQKTAICQESIFREKMKEDEEEDIGGKTAIESKSKLPLLKRSGLQKHMELGQSSPTGEATVYVGIL